MSSNRMPPRPRHLDEPRAIPTRPGMRRRSCVGPEDGVRELFIEELTFAPGSEIPLHHHPVVEAFVVLEGRLSFRLGDETSVVEAERTVAIPPGTPHAVVNASDGTARALATSPWDHDTFFAEATTYLEGLPRD